MELQGRIIAALEPRSGVSQRGEWKVQGFVVETHDTYPRKMVFEVFGEDRLQRFNIQVGQEVTVSFDIDAREYNGRWFNTIRAFDVRQVVANADPAQAMQPQQVPFAEQSVAPAAPTAAPAADPFASDEGGSSDDLPF